MQQDDGANAGRPSARDGRFGERRSSGAHEGPRCSAHGSRGESGRGDGFHVRFGLSPLVCNAAAAALLAFDTTLSPSFISNAAQRLASGMLNEAAAQTAAGTVARTACLRQRRSP
jgi:hypothetical protein